MEISGCTACDAPFNQSVKGGKNVKNAIWWRLAISFIIAGQSMVFSLGINATPPEVFSVAYWVLHGLLFGSSGVVFILLGWPLLKKTFHYLRLGQITIEWMFMLSAIGALIASLLSSIRGEGAVFYEVVAIVLCIYSLGKTISLHAKEQVKTAIYALKQSVNKVNVLNALGSITTQSAESVRVGDRFIVKPGEMIVMDGVIMEGQSYIEAAALTGEPMPRAYKPGDSVLAGMYALDGQLVVEVQCVSQDRLLNRLIASIELGVKHPSLLEVQANRLMSYFLPIVLSISLLTFVYWTSLSGWVVGLFNSMAVLLVACPCAFGLATPMGVWMGIWNLSKRGIIIKTGLLMDALMSVTVWVFDKTGTLTDPKMTVGGWHYQGDWVKEAFLIQNLVRSVEAGLKHPIATVFENHLPENQAFVLKSREWLAGEGVCGHVEWNSQIFDIKVGVMPELESVAPKTKSVGIKLNGVFVGWVVFEEVLREGVQPVFEHLFKKGHAISILTGDPAPTSPMLCGAPVYGGLSPMDKVEWVKNCQKSGASVIFIGDGLNDAGVMECANGSIAMGNYELLTSSVAQGIVLGPSLYPLLTAYELAMTIYKTMKRSWCFALFYNLVGMGFAVCGYLHPVLAALIMAASSGWVAYRAYQSAK